MQICGRIHPHIADNLSMPKACKRVLHPCAIETMRIIIFLLVVTQFVTTNKWHGTMDAALVGAIIHGGPQQKNKIRNCYPTPAFSGAQKRAEVLCNPCILGGSQRRGQNQKRLPHPCLLGGDK